ncbi:MAG: NAD(P)/FAD-dependent oxidoreductase [Planctomycetota bacterium]|nr:NAD(P)/FAD-dependent oxidoreductase [Planctomycetota bacterium]
MYDVAIIGAGMSGLAAGIRLAHFGQRVCILERHTTIGGLNSFYRLDGRNFDVGLHAVTNYQRKGAKQGPLPRLLRQLRFGWEEFELSPQRGSSIAFPNMRLRFSNDFELFRAEVAREFPSQIDGLDRLVSQLVGYDELDRPEIRVSSREVVAQYLSDPLLIEMLYCPLLYYGSASPHDMEWGHFSVMFRSVLLEGFSRPFDGVRRILKLLTRRYKERGGELRLRAGVSRIVVNGDAVASIELDDGSSIQARQVLSSVGWCETMRLCAQNPNSEPAPQPIQQTAPGRLSFIESISLLDRQPTELGHNETIVFFNDCDKFHWEEPATELADVRSGVICSPNNFLYPDGQQLDEGVVRITALAHYDRWRALNEPDYRAAKAEWYERMTASAVRFVPDFRPHTVAIDMFTPTTIQRFTWHDNGAVYGAPQKRLEGTAHLYNLFVCGTDQGGVGIIGAMMSGVLMANKHCLAATL